MSCKISIFQMLEGVVWGREGIRQDLVPSERNPIWTSIIKREIYKQCVQNLRKSWRTELREMQESRLAREHLGPGTQILAPSVFLLLSTQLQPHVSLRISLLYLTGSKASRALHSFTSHHWNLRSETNSLFFLSKFKNSQGRTLTGPDSVHANSSLSSCGHGDHNTCT